MTSNITQLTNSLTPYSPFVEEFGSKDVFRLICSYFSAHELVQLGSTNHYLYSQISSDSHLWNFLLNKCFSGLYTHSQLEAKGPFDLYKHLTIVQNNMRSGKYEQRMLLSFDHPVTNILIHEDKLISISDGIMITILDLKSGQKQTFAAHANFINSILAYKNKLISASSDCTIKIWDLESGKELQTLAGHRDRVGHVLVHGDKLISASDDCTIKIWDLENGKELKPLTGHQNWVSDILIYQDQLVSASADGTVKIWDLENGKELRSLVHRCWVRRISMHGNQLISALNDGLIKICDFKTGKELLLEGHDRRITTVIIYKDKLISGSCDCTIKIWDLESGKELQTLTGHRHWIHNILVYGDLLISVSEDNTIKIWDLESGKELQTLPGHGATTLLMHGNELVSASDDGTVKIWDFAVTTLQSEELDSLLAALGITAEECTEKLKCRPDYLKTIGILSLADVKALCHSLPGIQHLQVMPQEVSEDLNACQTQAFAKKDTVTHLLQTLLNAVNQRLKETENCTVLLYEGNDPWTPLKDHIIGYQTTLEEGCQTRKALLNKFNSESYAQIVEEVNVLIDMFEAVDREHQIAKLRAYVGQPYILGAWNNLRTQAQGINSLAALLETDRAPQDPFQMGE